MRTPRDRAVTHDCARSCTAVATDASGIREDTSRSSVHGTTLEEQAYSCRFRAPLQALIGFWNQRFFFKAAY